MSIIIQAGISEMSVVKMISEKTIAEIFPHYYPQGAVKFFLAYHNEDAILNDIKSNCVFLCLDTNQNAVGTVTIKANEISRLFVLPAYQRNGYGAKMLDYAETTISKQYPKAVLDASLPAKMLYQKRGYETVEFNVFPTEGNDFLCYDVMEKKL